MEADSGLFVGARIRELRGARGLSLTDLAKRADIGKGSLSELESGRRNPTLATLYAVATQLGVPLSALLSEQPGAEVSGDGLTVTLLDTQHLGSGRVVEVFRLQFAPGADRRSAPEQQGSREHLLVTEGRLQIQHRDGEHVLEPGAALSFASDAPHRYRALDDAAAAAVLVINSPGDAPGRR